MTATCRERRSAAGRQRTPLHPLVVTKETAPSHNSTLCRRRRRHPRSRTTLHLVSDISQQPGVTMTGATSSAAATDWRKRGNNDDDGAVWYSTWLGHDYFSACTFNTWLSHYFS